MRKNIIKVISIIITVVFAVNTVFANGFETSDLSSTQLLTVDDLERMYPGVPKKQITMEQFLILTETTRRDNSIQIQNPAGINQINKFQLADQNIILASYIENKRKGKKGGASTSQSQSDGGYFNFNFNFFGSRSGNGEGATVLFVIVGIVVVAVLLIAGTKIIYDTLTNPESNPGLFDIAASYTYFQRLAKASKVDSGETQNVKSEESELPENGSFIGGRLTFGLINVKPAAPLAVCMGFEAGEVDAYLNLEDSEQESIRLTGDYFMIGPQIRLYFGGFITFNFNFEVMAGTTEHKEVGVISWAKIGFDMGGDHFHVGINYGAVNIELKADEGFVREGGDTEYLSGFVVGFQF